MSSMYSLFKTDTRLEQEGVIIDYGQFRVTIARSGGANKRYTKILEAKTRPYRRAIETETLDPARGNDLLREVFAEAVVLNWEVLVDEEKQEWKPGIEGPNGDILPVTYENILSAFRLLPDLFLDLQAQSQKVALFRADEQAAASGN